MKKSAGERGRGGASVSSSDTSDRVATGKVTSIRLPERESMSDEVTDSGDSGVTGRPHPGQEAVAARAISSFK